MHAQQVEEAISQQFIILKLACSADISA